MELIVPSADCGADSLLTGVCTADFTCPRSGLVALVVARRCLILPLAMPLDPGLDFEAALSSNDASPPPVDFAEESSLMVDEADDKGDNFSWLKLEDIDVLRKVSCCMGLSMGRRVYSVPCRANGEIDELAVVAIIVSMPILSNFSTSLIPVSAFFSDLEMPFCRDFRLPCECEVVGSLLKVRLISSAPVLNSPNDSDGLLYGGGEDERDGGSLLSGELHGVAVGVKLRSLHGVATHDGVTALIPLSLSILASPRFVENVDVEFRRLSVLGVLMPELPALLEAVATRLPTILGVTLV